MNSIAIIIIFVFSHIEFVVQTCRSSVTTEPKWYPHLLSPCNDNGLPTSKDIYDMFPTVRSHIHTWYHIMWHNNSLIFVNKF